jgi:hypothetical protein
MPTPSYTGSTTLIPITVPDNTPVTSLTSTDGKETITLSTAFSAQTVGIGFFTWSTWGSPPNTESSTPRILAYFNPITSVTLTLSLPASTFGFEIEPDQIGLFPVSVSFYNGSTLLGTVQRNINGNAGALLTAASSTTPITSVAIAIPADALGFAMAQFRYAQVIPPTVPALSTAALGALGLLLAGAGTLLARARRTAGA